MKTAALYVVILALAVLFIAERCKGPPEPIEPTIPPAVADSIAELRRRTAASDSARIVADSISEALRVLAQQQANRANDSERRAAMARRGADSARAALVDAQSAGDSVVILVAVVERQDTAIASLTSALASQRASTAAEIQRVGVVAQQRDSAVANRDEWRRTADRFEGLLHDADARIVTLSKGCMLLGVVKCPSRASVFVGGLIVGAGVIYASGR